MSRPLERVVKISQRVDDDREVAPMWFYLTGYTTLAAIGQGKLFI
jgi:hypothetical protein